jgi:DNA polymerase-3 subunit alpha
LWPEQFAQFGSLVTADAIVGIRGSIDRRPGAEEVNLIVNELMPLAELATRFTSGVAVQLDERKHAEERLVALREIVRGYPGQKTLRIDVALESGGRVSLETPKRIDLHPELQRRVEELLGPGSFRLTGSPPASKPPTPKRPMRERSRA